MVWMCCASGTTPRPPYRPANDCVWLLHGCCLGAGWLHTCELRARVGPIFGVFAAWLLGRVGWPVCLRSYLCCWPLYAPMHPGPCALVRTLCCGPCALICLPPLWCPFFALCACTRACYRHRRIVCVPYSYPPRVLLPVCVVYGLPPCAPVCYVILYLVLRPYALFAPYVMSILCALCTRACYQL